MDYRPINDGGLGHGKGYYKGLLPRQAVSGDYSSDVTYAHS